MKALLDRILARRARHVLARLRPHLPPRGMVLDVGSGTGHNASAIENSTGLRVAELDVADINALGRPVVLFDGRTIPFATRSFDAATLLFVLHYVPDPERLLRELIRVSRGPVLVLQSVHAGPAAEMALRIRECIQGRLAFRIAARAGLIPSGPCPLAPLRYYTRRALHALFARAGLRVAAWSASSRIAPCLSRDLYVLERSADAESA